MAILHAVDEDTDKMSASGHVNSMVDIGGFFFVPNRIFLVIDKLQHWLYPDKEAQTSSERVGDYLRNVMHDSEKSDTYQRRLRKAGISDEEVKIQCDDVIFAGTDSTGTNLSMLLWYLAQHPEM